MLDIAALGWPLLPALAAVVATVAAEDGMAEGADVAAAAGVPDVLGLEVLVSDEAPCGSTLCGSALQANSPAQSMDSQGPMKRFLTLRSGAARPRTSKEFWKKRGVGERGANRPSTANAWNFSIFMLILSGLRSAVQVLQLGTRSPVPCR